MARSPQAEQDAVESPAPPSMREAAANVGARALGLVQTRIELAAVELAEARVRLVRSLLLVGAALGCAMLALMVATFGVIAWYWDTSRFTVITVMALLYLAAGALLWQRYASLGRSAPELLSATLAALRADASQLRGKSADSSP